MRRAVMGVLLTALPLTALADGPGIGVGIQVAAKHRAGTSTPDGALTTDAGAALVTDSGAYLVAR